MPSSPDLVDFEPALRPVPLSEMRHAWLAVQAPLSKLLSERDEYLPENVLEHLKNHTMQLWIGPDDSFVVTQVQSYPLSTILAVLYAGGSLETIEGHMGDLMAWARERGCNRLRVHGRAGWERVFHMERLGCVLEIEL